MKNNRAFTLIELSIVLVIIGLIAGGVLVGQDLIKAAELRKIINTQEQYTTAVNTFRLKYNCLPGDCPNATDFFAQLAECNPGAWNSLGCAATNGDNNKRIATSGTFWREHYALWHQLGESGLIDGRYCGNGINGMNVISPGTSTPYNKKYGIVYNFAYSSGASDSNHYASASGNALHLGAVNNAWVLEPAFTNTDAYFIDAKVDDGKPGLGIVVSLKPGFFTPNCVTTSNAATSLYKLSYAGPACVLIFTKRF